MAKQKSSSWLDKYDDGGPVQPNYNDASVSMSDDFVGDGYNTKGRNYSPAWGGQFAMGGSIPGSVGFTYARTIGPPAPSNGPYAKKTKASVQNGMEMKYYQEGLDFKPKTISKDGTTIYNPKTKIGFDKTTAKEYISVPPKPVAEPNYNAFDKFVLGTDAFVKDALDYKTYLKGIDMVAGSAIKGLRNIGVPVPDAAKEFFFNKVRPVSYPTDLISAAREVLRSDKAPPAKDSSGNLRVDEEAWSMAMGRPTKSKYIVPSKYKPSNAKDPNAKYHTFAEGVIDPKVFTNLVSDDKFWNKYKQVNKSGKEYLPSVSLEPYLTNSFKKEYVKTANDEFSQTDPLANFQIYRGVDPKTKKKYAAISDVYDFGLETANALTNPINFYDRFYYKDGGSIKDDKGQWAHPGEVTEIGSNQITMQGVPYPVMGISDTGDTQMMYPNQEYQYNGSSVTEYPMMADGGETDPKKKPAINLGDLTMTPEELEYVNASNSGYCPGGNCLENTRKGYDMTAGRIPGIPSSGDIWTKDLQLISTASTPSDRLVKENPYFRGDSSFGSADSWDIHGAIVKAGGKNIYSQAKGQAIPTDVAIGSMVGWGPTGTRESGHSNRNKGMNKDYGLQPSHHSTQVVNYDEKGEPIVYDSYLGKYGTLSSIGKDLKNSLGYEIENISVPKSVAGNTRENLAKKGLLRNELTEYSPDINKLIGGTKQRWAQIKEDDKFRSPKVDQDALSEFAKALSKNKGELVSSLRISNADYDRLANTALALAMTESEGGGALGFSDRFGSTQGMTQLNVDNIKNDARLKSALGKNYKSKVSVTNLLSPSSSAIATMMYLSVAEKDAKRLYDKGLKPGVRTFNEPGLIEKVRYTTSKLNKEGLFIDELNKRIPYSQIPGYEDEDVAKINNYLKKLTKSDRYNFVNKDGDLSLQLKTKGNNPKLTDVEKIAYMWQSPNSLKKGDAEGKSEYVNKVKNYFNLLNAKKMEQGGQLTKLDQLTNFTNYNTKQPGSWLDKYQ